MYDVSFSPKAWEDYLYWQTQDKKKLKRVNLLIQSVQREGFFGRFGQAGAVEGRPVRMEPQN